MHMADRPGHREAIEALPGQVGVVIDETAQLPSRGPVIYGAHNLHRLAGEAACGYENQWSYFGPRWSRSSCGVVAVLGSL